MSQVSHVQTSFNAGEVSRRLRARIDLNIYDIAVETMIGYAPLSEGGMEAMPGLIRVDAAPGPCRLIPFDYSATQGHVIEASEDQFRVYTNDVIIESEGAPVVVSHPYSYEDLQALDFEQSFDVMYMFHGDYAPRQFARTAADSFTVETFELKNGPFESGNADEDLTVEASAGEGDITLTASADLFEAGDVGGLFQLEAEDFADIASWEPGITVSTNKKLTWGGRVYNVVSGGRTGTVQPSHVEGVEWDGIGSGSDINGTAAGGVKLEYLYDRFGHVRITGFTDAQTVSATVLRRLPDNVLSAQGGTWRWNFGAFSPRRGYPQCGVLWGGRLLLAKGSTVYGSVVDGFDDHSVRNEQGEISTDMAFTVTLSDANAIEVMQSSDRALIITGAGCYALEPSNQAQGIGPGNIRAVKQNSTGAVRATSAQINGRVVYVDRSRRHIIEADYDAARDRQAPIDLSRYARQLGLRRFMGLAETRAPNRMLWTHMGDGSMAAAAYIPEESVLGWCRRELAEGLAARSICAITDPTGEVAQLWVAVEDGDDWHVCRMAQWRDDSEWSATPVMSDLAVEWEGAEASSFGPYAHFAGRTIEVVSEGRAWLNIQCDESGNFTLPQAVTKWTAGLPFQASVKLLPLEAGGDNGPARGKKRRIFRSVLEVLDSRGLRWRVNESVWRDVGVMQGGDVPSEPRDPLSGFEINEDSGDYVQADAIEIERVAPFQSTIVAVHRYAQVGQK